MKTRIGLDFFPVDVDWLEDNKLTMLLAEHGHYGVGILIRLLGEVYKTGYYLSWSERDRMKFARRAGEPLERVNAIVELLIEDGFFDRKLATGSEPILTSRGIQERWQYASSRRAIKTIQPDHDLTADGSAKKTSSTASVVGADTTCGRSVDNMPTKRKRSVSDSRRIVDQTETETETKTDTETKTRLSDGVVFPASLDTPQHREAWDRFLTYRKSIRKPYRTVQSQNAQLARWAQHPDAFIGAISATVANEWQGLHLPSGGARNGATRLSGREARTAQTLLKLAEQEDDR
jgi:hypothetical protein